MKRCFSLSYSITPFTIPPSNTVTPTGTIITSREWNQPERHKFFRTHHKVVPVDYGKLLQLHGCLQVLCYPNVVPFFAFFSKHGRISPGMVSMWVCTVSLFKFLVTGRPGFVWHWIQWRPEWEHDWKSLVPLKFWELSTIQRMVIDFCLLLSLLLSGRYFNLQVAIELLSSVLGQMCAISYVLVLRFLGAAT